MSSEKSNIPRDPSPYFHLTERGHYPRELMLDPYIIAEAGVNHEGSMELAKRLVDEAAEGGAHAIKFQTYKAHKIASKDSPSYWDLTKEPCTSQFELFKKYDSFEEKDYIELHAHCEKKGIQFLSTPFDVEAVDWLNDLMPFYKISSSDLNNHPFIEYMCKKGKPILLSTGSSHLWEIQETVALIQSYQVPVSIMHCILNYPTPADKANLGMIADLREKFPYLTIGYSDHTLPGQMDNLIYASLLGSVIIEKHFTHDKSLEGNDHYHAMDMQDLKLYTQKLKSVQTLAGSFDKAPLESEALSRQNARRSLVLKKDMRKDEVLTEESLTWKRPAKGIDPRYYKSILGQKVQQDLPEDTVLKWDMISSHEK